MQRGYRTVDQFHGERREVLNKLKAEFHRLCDEYGFERAPFYVCISAQSRHGNIRYWKSSRIVDNVSISLKDIHPAFMDELINTVRHEFAHMFTLKKYGFVDHGSVWKDVHRRIGGTSERCTNYVNGNDIKQRMAAHEMGAGVRVYNWIYKCICGEENKRTRRFTHDQAMRRGCRKCGIRVTEMKLVRI